MTNGSNAGSMLSPLGFMGLGATLGMMVGLVEATGVMALSLIPGGLSWRDANMAHVLWFAPLFYGAVGIIIALPLGFAARGGRRIAWDVGIFVILVWGGVYFVLCMHPQLLSATLAALLALGVASVLTWQYWRRRTDWAPALAQSAPMLAVTTLLLMAVVVGGGRTAEAFSMKGLPVAEREYPNILLFVIDTQRADHLSAYGYHRPTTPNLDRLASQGALFENAYSPSSWTLPSHATMFVGRPLHAHKAGLMRQPYLDGRFPTLAEALQAKGYATGGFVANAYWCGRQTGLDRGFVHYSDMYENVVDGIARTGLGRMLAYEVLPRFGFLDIPGRRRAAELNADLLTWIDEVDTRPFFAFVNYFDVHSPFLPPPPFAGRFSPLPTRSASSDGIEIGALGDELVIPDKRTRQRMIDRYDESLLSLDAAFGKLIESLRSRSLLDRTVIIVTSDHGESFGEHGLIYHGHSLYREQLHVPLIIRYPPKVERGGRILAPVGLDQLPATAMSLAGLKPKPFPSRSLFDAPHAAEQVVAELGRRSLTPSSWPSSRGWVATLITDRWQFIRNQRDRAHLYDIVTDPAERHDLAARDNAASLIGNLGRRLNKQIKPQGLEPLEFPLPPIIDKLQRLWAGRGPALSSAEAHQR